jgi:dihydroorotate dehydrogenase
MAFVESVYKNILRPIAFRFDPENIHERVLKNFGLLRSCKSLVKNSLRISDQRLKQTIWGYEFTNPIGLAGGFDKNAKCVDLWELFGFGFIEIGTITPRPQEGNPKPRLFRYPESEAIVNRMGFNNDGCIAVSIRLEQNQKKRRKPNLILGVSIGKQKTTPADDIDLVKRDYLACLKKLYPFGDFFVVNVSSPNTPNLRQLQQSEPLSEILVALKEEIANRQDHEREKPLLVKFAPDLKDEEIIESVNVALECGIDGIIATNTTNQTAGLERGGLSGKPLRSRSTEVIKLIAKETRGTLPIIGCGGIFTAEDAIEKFQAGAWLLQCYTGFVYEGPTIVNKITRGLIEYLDKNNLSNIDHIRVLKKG